MKRGPESIVTLRLLNALRKAKKPVWARVAEIIRAPRRRRPEISLARLGRVTKEGDKVVVPGKIIGAGKVGHKLTIGYLAVSKASVDELEKEGIEAMPFAKFIEANKDGKGVKIIV
ncbi:50S ribosomal protein L18e [Candidatus Micrarchaeota archaeon]|nr:50S ribosomal protein L18e [Candidatus Micrarchaeota archaeon]